MTFKELNEANVARNDLLFKDIDNHWSLADWSNAIAGETGELCNKIKKVRRGENIPKEDLEEELGDIVIYADLLAKKLDTSLEKCVKQKFNAKSKLWNCHIKLGE
jgi:NTP pyrophosphatase (non-canonical NTP hydrolase)